MVTRPATPWYYAGATGGITDTTAVALAPAAATSANWLSGLQYHNTSATGSEITILDGATVIWRGYAPASMTHPAVMCFDPPLRGSVNTAMNAAMVTTGTATVVSAQGIISA